MRAVIIMPTFIFIHSLSIEERAYLYMYVYIFNCAHIERVHLVASDLALSISLHLCFSVCFEKLVQTKVLLVCVC